LRGQRFNSLGFIRCFFFLSSELSLTIFDHPVEFYLFFVRVDLMNLGANALKFIIDQGFSLYLEFPTFLLPLLDDIFYILKHSIEVIASLAFILLFLNELFLCQKTHAFLSKRPLFELLSKYRIKAATFFLLMGNGLPKFVSGY
jgi:hypothetical protein